MAKAKTKAKANALLFVDTNVFLDFYRLRDTGGLSLLRHLETHKSQIIMTSQVEVEFKKNRQKVILDYLKGLKEPDWNTIAVPGFMSEAKAVKALRKLKTEIGAQVRRIRTSIEAALRNPGNNDEVFKLAQRIFRSKSAYKPGSREADQAPYPISCPKKIRPRISAAKRRRSVNRRCCELGMDYRVR